MSGCGRPSRHGGRRPREKAPRTPRRGGEGACRNGRSRSPIGKKARGAHCAGPGREAGQAPVMRPGRLRLRGGAAFVARGRRLLVAPCERSGVPVARGSLCPRVPPSAPGTEGCVIPPPQVPPAIPRFRDAVDIVPSSRNSRVRINGIW